MSATINLNGAAGTGTTYSTEPTPVYLFPAATFSASSTDRNAIDTVTVALATHTSSMSLALDATAAALASANNITVTYNSTTGVLTLAGSNESDLHWQSILDGVIFNDTSATPTDPGSVTVTAINGTSSRGSDTQDLHLDPPPTIQFESVHNNADSFDSASYSLNNGTNNWAGNWTEGGETTNPTSGSIQIVNNELRLGDNSNNSFGGPWTVTREASATLPNATSATLSFDYTSNTNQSSEAVTVEISTDGSHWTTLGLIGGNGADGTFSQSISNYISGSTYIRFSVPNTLDANEFVNIDNVNLAYTVDNSSLPTQTVNFETNPHIFFNSSNGNEIKVSDINDSNLTVTLTVAHGTLTLGGTTGLTSVSGNGTSAVTFSGSLTNLNAALNGLDYQTTSTDTTVGNVDDTLTITTSDGHTGGTDTSTVQIDVICFYPGTLIRTPDGEMKVETLKQGDLVVTNDGRELPVSWLGRQTVSTVFADKLRVLPVRIKAGALADNTPSRDLLISPDHALLVDGVLIQAGALVNGTSIVRETGVPRVFTYYHVEVDDHSLILAENTPAETFIDNVDRLNFDNWAEHQAHYPEGKTIEEMRYPRAKAHRQVPVPTRVKLAERAQAIGATAGVVAA
jgi:hypothetical protein